MVIIFSNKKAREQLMKKGIVYSYRKMHPKTLDGIRLQMGDDWATDKRGGKKIADVRIILMEYVDRVNIVHVLRKYVNESGFRTVREWSLAIKSLNPLAPARARGWIYKVVKR